MSKTAKTVKIIRTAKKKAKTSKKAKSRRSAKKNWKIRYKNCKYCKNYNELQKLGEKWWFSSVFEFIPYKNSLPIRKLKKNEKNLDVDALLSTYKEQGVV